MQVLVYKKSIKLLQTTWLNIAKLECFNIVSEKESLLILSFFNILQKAVYVTTVYDAVYNLCPSEYRI